MILTPVNGECATDSRADDMPRSPQRVLLVCSTGGHLLQLHRLRPWWAQRERMWVTFDLPDAASLLRSESVVHASGPTTRSVRNLLRNFVLAARTFRRYHPDAVVSNGAGVAFPFFVLARLHRVETVYIEVYDRIDSPSLTGRLCYPITDLFLVQWDSQKRFYPKAKVLGRLL
jgi:beta-1,4-N-acetylglucosaminyltransferase